MCDYIFDAYVIVYVYVNGLHHAQAPTYDCTVANIYDMTLTTHSVMCHIYIWNIILYLVLELPFTYFGNTHEHNAQDTIERILCSICGWLLIRKSIVWFPYLHTYLPCR